jgi:hypothetical protein
MKRMIYQVCVGKPSKLYEACIESAEKYCEKYGFDHIVQTKPILRIKPDVFATNRNPRAWEQHGGYLPIFEKENAFDYLDDYDQIAIIDADIYIKENSPNIFDELGNHVFGAVCEREMPINGTYLSKIENYSKSQYSTLKDVDWKWHHHGSPGAEFFNMGLMVFSSDLSEYLRGQTAREFLNRIEFKRFVDGDGMWKWSTDQTLLNWWVKKEEIDVKHIDWKFNALFTALQNGKEKEAHFVHFFKRDNLPSRGENIKEILEII